MGFGMFSKHSKLLLLILLLGLALRLYMLAEKELGVDEAFQIELISKPVSEVIRVYLNEEPNNPPLHGLITHAIFVLFGSYYFVKLFSVFCGLASIFFCYKIGEKLFNKDIALLSALLLAFNPLHIFYSQHTRAYAMVIFLFSVFFYMLLIFLENLNEKKYAIALGLIAALFLYTHYVAIIVVLCTATFFAYLWWKNKIDIKNVSLALIIAIILFMPQALVLVTHPALGKNQIYERGILDLPYIFYKFANGANISFLISKCVLLLAPALLINSLFALGLLKLFKEKRVARLFGFFFFLPYLFIALATIKVSHFFYFRNFTYLLPLYALPIGYYIANLKNKNFKVALLIFIILGWLAIVALYYSVAVVPDWNVDIGL